MDDDKRCVVTGCDRIAKRRASGMCERHYKRLWKYGDPNHVERIRDPGRGCAVEGCRLPHLAKGLCGNHYKLMERNGKPEVVRSFTGSYIKDGYRYVKTGYRHYEPEHRLAMEAHIGRKLSPEEHVHHKDENTLNNAVENLEVVSASHHMGLHRTKINAASGKARRGRSVKVR